MNRRVLSGSFMSLAITLALICGLALCPAVAIGSDYKPMTIKISHGAPTGDPRHIGALKMKEVIEKESGGKIKVDIYPSQQLGSGRETLEAGQGGAIEINIAPSPFLGGFQPLITVMDVPYFLPDDSAAARKIIQGPAGQALLKSLEKANFVGLGFWDSAYKHFTCNRAATKPSDFEGLKFRVMPSKILMTMIKSLGASAITFPYTEVYTALQTGAIDGIEGSLTSIYNMKFYEAQKYVIKTYHIKSEFLILASKVWFDKLSPKAQKLMYRATREASDVEAPYKAEQEKKAAGLIEKGGTKILSLTPAQLQKFKDTMQPPCLEVFLKTNGEKGKAIVELFKKEMAKLK